MLNNDRKIVLIRHGETEWSQNGRHTGMTDLPLLEKGRIQVQLMAPLLREMHFKKVFTSPLRRAMESCEIAGFMSRAEIDPDLVEWNYGDYEGLTYQEITAKNPGWTIFTKGAPGGESPTQIGERADRVLAKINHIEGNVALFSSGHFLRVLAARWRHLPALEGRGLALSPASISILGYERTTPVICMWNNRSHLNST